MPAPQPVETPAAQPVEMSAPQESLQNMTGFDDACFSLQADLHIRVRTLVKLLHDRAGAIQRAAEQACMGDKKNVDGDEAEAEPERLLVEMARSAKSFPFTLQAEQSYHGSLPAETPGQGTGNRPQNDDQLETRGHQERRAPAEGVGALQGFGNPLSGGHTAPEQFATSYNDSPFGHHVRGATPDRGIKQEESHSGMHPTRQAALQDGSYNSHPREQREQRPRGPTDSDHFYGFNSQYGYGAQHAEDQHTYGHQERPRYLDTRGLETSGAGRYPYPPRGGVRQPTEQELYEQQTGNRSEQLNRRWNQRAGRQGRLRRHWAH
ncbi:hypothetical protein F4778DRAFT_750534 [Xylariomycetidae sp. FL2044]|nr:hypothetical protein F4778DRAFT_750534 [Xylariomycetidae sp. FL2044]